MERGLQSALLFHHQPAPGPPGSGLFISAFQLFSIYHHEPHPHTRPWEIIKHGTPEHSPQFGIYAEGELTDLAIVKGDNAEANARLIHAAPELLKAITRLSLAASHRENTMGDPCRLIKVQAELRDATQQAQQAITQATTP